MSESSQSHDGNIDFIEIFETLWNGRWQIIATTFVAALFGIGFSAVKPNSFEVLTPIDSGRAPVFTKYIFTNRVLKNNDLPLSIDNASLFAMFIREFQDYEEMIDALKSSEYVQKSTIDSNEINKQRALVRYAKLFEIKEINERWFLSFEWHDDLEGRRLFNDAIRKTLINVRDITKATAEDLAEVIDYKKARELEKLSLTVETLAEVQRYEEEKKLNYLIEQSAIARELGIESNALEAGSLINSPRNGIAVSVNSNHVPYFLRGYKTIDKEISLLQSRSEQISLLNSEEYTATIKRIRGLENDLSSFHLNAASQMIANDNPNEWVEFNFALSKSESQKKSMFYVALSIIVGGMIGAMWVLISKAVRNRKRVLLT